LNEIGSERLVVGGGGGGERGAPAIGAAHELVPPRVAGEIRILVVVFHFVEFDLLARRL
jgi:hypothetical protein